MSDRLRHDETPRGGVRRTAGEQIEKALEESDGNDAHGAVHDVRKRLKKLRALLRLVRSGMPEVYERENARFRDTGRELSATRDAQSVVEAFDRVPATSDDRVDPEVYAPIRPRFVAARPDGDRVSGALSAARGSLREGRDRLDDWSLETAEFGAIRDNVEKCYRRGRRRMAEAYAVPSAEAFHEWRKRLRYHRYHPRLLRDLWRPLLDRRRAALHGVSDLLGEARDLGLLRKCIAEDPVLSRDSRAVESLFGLVEQRRAEVRALARPIGPRLYAEKPKCLGDRLESYWSVFRDWGGVEPLVAADADEEPGREQC